jgi:hypothetical protein
MSVKITAFGALNHTSYEVFRAHLMRAAQSLGVSIELMTAGPYPNAEAVSQPGRPLRAEALQAAEKQEALLRAVAEDAIGIGAQFSDMCCMPCMSMIGFHAGVEKALGRTIFPLAPALADKYAGVDAVGVIHMRPAQQRIIEIFGTKAVTADEAQAARLLEAEKMVKLFGSAAPVEDAMKEIVECWSARGLKNILFARADAPKAEESFAGKIEGVVIESYFSILAEAMALKAREIEEGG